MRKPLARLSLLAAFAAFTQQALAQIQLPSVPIGGVLGARVTLAQLGGSALAGVPVTLSIPGNCGTFRGASTLNVVTDSTGGFLFDFTPNGVPGVCTIQGRSGNITGTAQTNVYRAAELQMTWAPDDDFLVTLAAGTTTVRSMRLTVRANGAPVYNLRLAVDPPVALAGGGSPPQLAISLAPTTSLSGEVSFTLSPLRDPGVWDYVIHAASTQRALRVQQQAAAPTVTPARSLVAADDLKDAHGSILVSIVDAPASCMLREVTRMQATSAPPSGATDFPQGVLALRITGCPSGATVRLRAEYPTPLPADGLVYASTFSGSWTTPAGATVSGNAVIFSLVEGASTDSASGPDFLIRGVGVARRGQRVDQAKPAVHDMWWAGQLENGWGMSMAQAADGNVFGAIYAYDDAGKPTWWVLPTVTWDYSRGSFEDPLYSTFGTPWNAYDARYIVVNKAGSAKLTLSSTGNVTLNYAIDGVAGVKTLERQVFGPPDSRTVPNVDGMWWGGISQNGWGVSIVQHNATLFMVWFTYDETMKPTWFVMPGGQWNGTNVYEGRIYRTHGSPWLGRTYDASRLTVTDVGPYRLTFNGTSATMAYTVDGRAGSLPLVRQAPF